jgi:hypothetical protein
VPLAQFLKNLEAVAASPYAFAAYIAVVAAWVYTSAARHRLKKMAEMLATLPPEERTRVLLKEYSTAPRSGLSADQWIASRRHLLFFLGFLAAIVCATIVVIVALARTPAPGKPSEQSADANAVIGVLAAQSQRILELEHRVQAAEAQAAELKATLAEIERAKATPGVIELVREMGREYLTGGERRKLDTLLADARVGEADKAALGLGIIMNRIDADIEDQSKRLDALRDLYRSGSARDAPSIEVETMKLKRLIDKRAQTFDLMRQILDKYDRSAKKAIESTNR